MSIRILLFLLAGMIIQGCGVKGKPLPPLQQPFISTGSYKEDYQNKQKDKKKSQTPSPEQEVITNENQ